MTTFNFPITITSAGAQPQTPASLQQQLIAAVSATNPGYTANLPGSLVEDISSTDVFAVALCDQARVEAINSLTPNGANEFVLTLLGQVYGVPIGQTTNTSVLVQFSGPVGYVIAQGFIVGDGTYQYALLDGGVIQTGGTSDLLTAVATTAGTWSVPANTVTELVTSVPSGTSLSVTNPQAGTPGTASASAQQYRTQVMQAGLAAAQGMPSFLKTQLQNISGVDPRLVSVRQQTTGKWEVICGGGDAYAVAYAIYMGIGNIAALQPSVIGITGITQANPGVVTTDLNHGYTTGESVTISGVDPSTYDGTYTVTVLTETTFSIGVDTTGYAAYVSGGECSPNNRNVTVSLSDYPDVYSITYVDPPQQTVTITATWNTTISNFTGSAAVAQLAAPAMIDYINSIPVGSPINILELTATLQNAVASVLPTFYLTRLIFSVSINGVGVSPASGESYINGDPESYFYASSTSMTITQG